MTAALAQVDLFAAEAPEQQDRRSGVAPFTICGVTFVCWVVDGGRYEWRSECGRYAVGRVGPDCWARRDGRGAGDQHASLRAAMAAAIDAGMAK